MRAPSPASLDLDALSPAERAELEALLESIYGGESFADFVARITPTEPLPAHTAVIADIVDEARRRPQKVCISMPPGHAKLCADSTPVLTPSGWTTHGELRVGDEVYAPDGTATRVKHVTEKGMATLAVTFSDGEVIRVNPGHRWTVRDRRSHRAVVMETGDILTAGLTSGKIGNGSPRLRWLVPFAAPVAGRHVDLPVDPYLLGLWLGDGTTSASRITQSAADAAHSIAELERRGHTIGARCVHATTGCVSFQILGTKVNRIAAGKRIPDVYYTADEVQRRDLLRGLVDSDGHVGASGKVRFSNANRGLIDDAVRLVATLGYRVSVNHCPPPAPTGRAIEQKVDVWQVAWTPTDGEPQGLLPRRAGRHRAMRRDRAIVSIEPCAPEPGHCIMVEHPSSLYLVGDRLVPTHNTTTLLRAIAWWLCRVPADTCAYVTYSDAQARSKSRLVRDWARVGGARLAPDLTGMAEWRTVQNGGLLAAGSRGKLNGQRIPGLLIVDDPYKSRDEVTSDVIRTTIYDRFREVALTRLQGGSCVILHTRWSEDDLIGRVQRDLGWDVINLPAISHGEGDRLGRPEGAALWPERYPVKECAGDCGHDGHLEKIRAEQGPYSWSALYDGSPAPAEGGLFKRQWWRYFKLASDAPSVLRPPHASTDPAVVIGDRPGARPGTLDFDWICLTVDATFGATGVTADSVGLLVVGGRGQGRYVLEDLTAPRTFNETLDAMRAAISAWRVGRVLVEKAANGDAIVEQIRAAVTAGTIRDAKGKPIICAVEALLPKGGKTARANAMVGAIEAGTVYLREGAPWLQRFIDEHAVFPNAAHDDRVDALSQCVNYYAARHGTLRIPM